MPKTSREIDRSTFVVAKNTLNDNVELIAATAHFQVGTLESPSDTTLLGRTSLSAKALTNPSPTRASGGTIKLDSNVVIALIKTPTRIPVTVYLPPDPRNGQVVWVKDRDGTASGSTYITIMSEKFLIDGTSSVIIDTPYGSKCLCWCDDMWSIIS